MHAPFNCQKVYTSLLSAFLVQTASHLLHSFISIILSKQSLFIPWLASDVVDTYTSFRLPLGGAACAKLTYDSFLAIQRQHEPALLVLLSDSLVTAARLVCHCGCSLGINQYCVSARQSRNSKNIAYGESLSVAWKFSWTTLCFASVLLT